MIGKISAAVPYTSFGRQVNRQVTFVEEPKAPRQLDVNIGQDTFGIGENNTLRVIRLSEEPHKEYIVSGVSPDQISALYDGQGPARIQCDSIRDLAPENSGKDDPLFGNRDTAQEPSGENEYLFGNLAAVQGTSGKE